MCLYLGLLPGHNISSTACLGRSTIMIRRFIISAKQNKPPERAASTARSFNEIPAPKFLPVIGTTLSLIAAGGAPKLHLYIDKRHQELGTIFRDKIGPVSAVFVSDPEYIRTIFRLEGKYPEHVVPEGWVIYNEIRGCPRGLIFMDGEEWWQYRKILNKLLLKGDFSYIEEPCTEAAEELVKRLKHLTEKYGAVSDLEGESYRWSLNVILAILMGSKAYQSSRGDLQPLLERLASTVHLVFETSVSLQLIPASLAQKFDLHVWKNFVSAVDNVLNTATTLVNELLDKYPKGDGLLATLLQEDIERSVLTRIITDLILAAGDTTANSLQWMLYLIAKNPEVQEKLRENIRSSDAQPMLKNILRETLRLYPVAPFLTRYLPAGGVIGGYTIPQGTLTIASLYSSGRNAKYFKNPEAFSPDRWVRVGQGTVAATQQASLPFAIGVRSCVGKKIAEIQLQTALAAMVGKFRVDMKNKRDVEMVLKMVAVPSEPVLLSLEEI